MLSTFYDVDFTDLPTVPDEPEGYKYTINIVKSPKPFFIGIYFSINENGDFVVRKLRKGTSAHLSGQISKGDLIVSLNGKSVMRLAKETVISFVENLPINENIEIKLCRPKCMHVPQKALNDEEMDSISLHSIDTICDFDDSKEDTYLFPEVSEKDKQTLFKDLETAVIKGDTGSVKECMNRHFEQSHVLFNEAPCDPLHLACAKGHQDLVICLSGIIDVNKVSENFGGTPLFVATKHNQLAIVEILIDNKAKQFEKISYKNAPLHLAIENGYVSIAKILEAHNTQVKEDTKLCIFIVYLCCQYGQLELLKYFWKPPFDPNEIFSGDVVDNGCSSLLSISFQEKLSAQECDKAKPFRDIIRFLYDKGAVISQDIALTYADEVFRFLKSKNKENFPSVVNWSSKHLAYINFDAWLSSYTDNIVELNLSGNRFDHLPSQIPWQLPNVERLIICRCSNLISLSSSKNPSFCSRLTKVVVSNNPKLSSIPICWFDVPNLRHLDFSSNILEGLPFIDDKVWECKQLNALYLQNNILKEIPSAIHGTINLKMLSLADNRLTNLPPAWNCPLNKLDASRNELTCVSEKFCKHWQRSLQYLYLNFNKIKIINSEIYCLSRLTDLNLSWNQIETIDSSENWQCKRLRNLNLAHNLLGGPLVKSPSSQQSPVSHWLFSNKNLRSESSPSIVVHDTNNKNPSNGANQIERDVQFPTIFAEKITSLNLSSNALSVLPKEICKFTSLVELDLSENKQLRHLPPELGRLHNLERLNITKLNIENLPNSMNPKFTDSSSTTAILSYLRSKLRREETCNRIKIVVLGREGSGKSTLISNLVGSKNMRKRAISPVSTYWWNLEPPPDKRHKRDMKTLQLCLWELSEPETYNQLHQCFMNAVAAVFVLVIRVDGYSFPDITSWLLNIKLRAPKANVLLVGTFIDKLSDNADFKAEMRKKSEIILETCARLMNGPKIVDFIGVSTQSTSSFNAVKYAIYEHCWQFLKNRKVPLSYNKIHLSVLQEKENRIKRGLTPIITSAQLWEIIMNTPDNDIEYGDEEELNNVADLMHDSGVLLHYSLNVRSLAIMCYYLDPEWLAEKMMRIVGPQGKKRKLTISEALEILRVKRSFDDQQSFSSNETTDISELMATHVIEIMQRFELLLLLNKNLVLIPCKLPAEGPEMDLNLRGSMISRLYRMACTPSGFWSRLIVRLLVRLEDDLPHKYTPRNLSVSDRKISTLQRTITLRHTMTSYDVGNMWQLLYWAEGVILQVKEGCLKVEALKQSFLRENFAHDDVNGTEGVLVTWQSRYNEVELSTIELALFTIAIDETDLLISEWFPDFDFGEDRIQRYVLCPSCLINLMQKQVSFDPNEVHLTDCVGCFPLEALAACALKSQEIACPLHKSEYIPLKNLVPDLLLTDVPNLHCLNPANLVTDTYVTKGGQAALFRGHYCNQEVAIKTFLAADNIVHMGTFGDALTCRTVTRHSISANLFGPIVSGSGSSGSSDFFSPDNELPILFAFQRMRREVVFIASLNHPCIISIVGAMVHPCQPLCFILEFAAMGNLSDYLSQRRDIARNALCEPTGLSTDDAGFLFSCIVPRQLTYKFAWQIIVALQYLHAQGILFRDLKAENILVWSENCDSLVNVKLSDYGISCYSAPQGIIGTEGTPGYQAPEVLKNMTYDDKADIFSYGMVIYELLSGLPPFNEVVSNVEVTKLVKNGKHPSLKDVFVCPDYWPLLELMEECWQTSPVERPSANKIRDRMEDFTFAILRQQLFVKLPEYFSTSAKLIWDPNRFPRKLSKKPLSDSMHLQPYPIEKNYCWLLFGNEELKCYHVLDVDKCKFVEKDFVSMPGSTTVTSCSYNDCIILVNQDEKQTVIEIFKDSQQNYLPIYLDRIGLETVLSVTSCCCVSGPKQNAETFLLFLGLKSGEIASLSIDFASKELIHQSCWTFSSGCNRIKVIVNSNNRLFAASGGFMFVLNYDKLSVEAVICVFNSVDVDFLCIHEISSSIWCASKTGDIISVYSILSPYALLVSINVSHLIPTGIETNRSTDSNSCYSVIRVCGLLSVKDTIWLALDDGIIYVLSTISRDFGRLLANFQIPKDTDYKNFLIENMELVKDSVVTVVKYRDQIPQRKPSGSDAEHSLDVSRRPSCSRNVIVPSLTLEKTKAFIWEAADLNRLSVLRQMWASLKNAEHDGICQTDFSSRSSFRNTKEKLSQQN